MMSDDLHLVHWLWLANALGFCASNAAEVLAAFETPEQLYAARRTENLAAFFTPHQLHVLQDSEPEDFFARLADCRAQQVHIIAFDDENYPEPLRQLATVPPVLYYRGDITLPGRSLTFAMIGTRRPSAYGVEATRAIAKPLAEVGVVLATDAAVLALLTVCVGNNRSLFIQPNMPVPMSIAAPAIIAVLRRCLAESLTDCEGGNTCDVVAAKVAGLVTTLAECGFGLCAMLLMLLKAISSGVLVARGFL